MAIDERRGAEDDVLGEHDLGPDGLDRFLLGGDVAGHVLAGLAILRALGEVIRLEQLDRLDRGGPMIDGHEVDAAQGPDHLRPQILGKGRAMRPLVDPLIGRQSDHENVAVTLGLLKMPQMADVQQIEDAVTVHDLLAVVAQVGEDRGEIGQVLDLALGRDGRTIGLRFHGSTHL